MKKFNVNSSTINSVIFDEKELILFVHFKAGTIYKYFPFYENQLKNFIESPSKGKWLNENVKKNKSIICKKVS